LKTNNYLEIFSILSDLQYGQNNIVSSPSIISFVRSIFGSLKKFLLQLLQCHVILIPSTQYRFVISSSYNNLSFNGGYQLLKPIIIEIDNKKRYLERFILIFLPSRITYKVYDKRRKNKDL
jgi:hypothetical protein